MSTIIEHAESCVRKFLQNGLLFPFLKHCCSSFEILGLENLNDLKGPCIFVANHSSHADVAIILCALPAKQRERLKIAAAAEYFYTRKSLAVFVTLMLNTFAFERCHPRSGMLKAKSVLEQGQSLLIFPQGTRSNPLDSVCFKRGFASLACKLGLPVVPICIEGSHEMLPKGAKWPRKSSVRIVFGEPLFPKSRSSNQLAHEVESRVHDLLTAA